MKLPWTREQWETPGLVAGQIRDRRTALGLQIRPHVSPSRVAGVACVALGDGTWRVLGAAHHLGIDPADLEAVESGTARLDWSRRHSVALFLGVPMDGGVRTV